SRRRPAHRHLPSPASCPPSWPRPACAIVYLFHVYTPSSIRFSGFPCVFFHDQAFYGIANVVIILVVLPSVASASTDPCMTFTMNGRDKSAPPAARRIIPSFIGVWPGLSTCCLSL